MMGFGRAWRMGDDLFAITGAAGFLGRHLTPTLDAVSIPYRALSRRPAPNAGGRAEWLTGDLRDPLSSKSLVVPHATVVHAAYSDSLGLEGNRAILDNLIDAALSVPARAFVYVSTAIVVGSTRATVVDEATTPLPQTAYAKTKLALEQRLKDRLNGRRPWLVVRPTAIFGEGGTNLVSRARRLKNSTMAVNWLLASALYRRRMNLVAVGNVVAAIRHLALRAEKINGGTFIVSDDHVPENSHGCVDELLRKGMGMNPYPVHPLVFPEVIMQAGFLLTRGSWNDPCRIFSSARLDATEFSPPEPFAGAVERFGAWWARRQVASA